VRHVLLAAACVTLVNVPLFAAGRTVSFSSSDGTALAGTFYETSVRPAPAVVLVHMLGRSREEWAPYAERLQDAGIAALTVDLRGHGRSAGSSSDLAAMAADVRAAATWLAAQPSVRPGALGIVGASLGANLAALAAGEMPAVRAVGLVSPSLDYRGVRLDAALLKKLEGRGVWLAASREDPLAARTVRELAALYPAAEPRVVPVRAHGMALFGADAELFRALVDWLRRTLIF
jgi:dienelactone hydrolase